jgi:hypothetical protein
MATADLFIGIFHIVSLSTAAEVVSNRELATFCSEKWRRLLEKSLVLCEV